jgi:hypothetical protein
MLAEHLFAPVQEEFHGSVRRQERPVIRRCPVLARERRLIRDGR